MALERPYVDWEHNIPFSDIDQAVVIRAWERLTEALRVEFVLDALNIAHVHEASTDNATIANALSALLGRAAFNVAAIDGYFGQEWRQVLPSCTAEDSVHGLINALSVAFVKRFDAEIQALLRCVTNLFFNKIQTVVLRCLSRNM